MANSLLDLRLGIDFGTSFTKVCFRDTALDRSEVVTFSKGKGRPMLDEALLPTKLGVCSDGRLLAGLTKSEWEGQTATIQIAVAVDYIKMRLANLDLASEGQEYPSDLLQSFQGSNLNTPENIENLCVYYLSNVIIKAQEWVKENKAALVKNQEIIWSANIGVPVQYCDSQAINRFTKVLRLAWLLSRSESYPETFNELQQIMTRRRRELNPDIRCFAVPEIAAAVYSYTVSRQVDRDVAKVYIFFDVGSGTIEGASFRLWHEHEMPQLDFYSGQVEPLGVNALAKWVNGKVPSSEAQVESDIIQDSQSLLQDIKALSKSIANQPSKGDYIANKLKVTYIANQFKVTKEVVENALLENRSPEKKRLLHLILGQRLIQRQVAKVVMTCKEKAPDYFQQSPLRVFLGGGGKEAEFYRETIESTHFAFNQRYADVPAYNLEDLPFPDNFDMNGIDLRHFHRFAIAYGLSIPEYQAPELKLPSQFKVKPQPQYQPITPEIGRYPDDNSSM